MPSASTGFKTVLGTQNQVTIQSGEGMLALWGALKSVIRPGDRVLAVATGLFGYGIGEMARQIGARWRSSASTMIRPSIPGLCAKRPDVFGRGW